MNIDLNVTGKASILLFSSDAESIRSLTNTFSALSSFEIESKSLSELNGKIVIDRELFDVAIVDLGDGSILDGAAIFNLRSRLPNLPMIFISEPLSQERMRAVVKLDGADWLSKPVATKSIIDAVNGVVKRYSSKTSKVHAVLPCGGGSGATTVAIMLSYFLSRKRKRVKPSAALFDFDFSNAFAGAYLNIESDFDLGTVANHPERVDQEFVNIIKKSHESGFSLFSFEGPQLMHTRSGSDLVLRMLDIVSFQHDHTIVDLPSTSAPWEEQLIKAVNTVSVVCGTTVPSLQRAKEQLKRVQEIRGTDAGVNVIINRAKIGLFGSAIGKKEIKKVFGDKTTTILGKEDDTHSEALNRGVLPIEVNSRSQFCKKLQKFSASLLEEVS